MSQTKEHDQASAVAKDKRIRLPAGIWAMGFASMFMDISSELIHALLPLFMVTVLGSSMASIGIVEGLAEATAALTRAFSGALSDRLQNRKWLMVGGYALSTITKPIFPLATSLGWVLAARSVDRIGKGIRGAPRDALIADITPKALRGTAFGLRQALDSVGAFLGPLAALFFMWLFAGDIADAMWVAFFPAAIAVILLIVFVREPHSHTSAQAPNTTNTTNTTNTKIATTSVRTAFNFEKLVQLGTPFWNVTALAAVFTLARFTDAFLILRAHELGLSAAHAPVIMVLMNIVYAALAYPCGKAADRFPARRLLAAGLMALILADLALAFARDWMLVCVGAVLWGAHMALTQGLFAKLITDTASATQRGSAFGVFGLVSAIALLAASSTAGALWNIAGARFTFLAGAAFASIALTGLFLIKPTQHGR